MEEKHGIERSIISAASWEYVELESDDSSRIIFTMKPLDADEEQMQGDQDFSEFGRFIFAGHDTNAWYWKNRPHSEYIESVVTRTLDVNYYLNNEEAEEQKTADRGQRFWAEYRDRRDYA